jgi:hypothetical protein
LSDELGTVAYGENQDEVFLGQPAARQLSLSKATLQRIDAEIERLVKTGYATAQRVLIEKRTELEVLAKGLLEYETLSGDEIKRLLAPRSAKGGRCRFTKRSLCAQIDGVHWSAAIETCVLSNICERILSSMSRVDLSRLIESNSKHGLMELLIAAVFRKFRQEVVQDETHASFVRSGIPVRPEIARRFGQ